MASTPDPLAALKGANARKSRLADAPGNDRYQYRAGSSLTPQVVSQILRSADLGNLAQQADLFDEVREKDGHLQNALQKRESVVAGAEWELRDQPGTAKRKAAKIKKLCTDALTGVCRFSSAIADLQAATYHGRAVLEAIYQRDGRYWLPERLEPVHARRLAYAPNDWRLRIWDPSDPRSPFSATYGVAIEELNKLLPGKFLVHTPRIRGGYPQREGLGRITVWYAGVFKAFGWRDFLAYAEQYGRPIRWGLFGTGKDPAVPPASPEDVDELEEALVNLSSALVGVFPDTTRPQIEKPAPASGSVHPDLIGLCDGEVSKAVNGSTLTSQVGSTGGNRALGEVHREIELMIARSDARAVAETIRDQLLTPLVLMNGLGDRRDVPTLRFLTDPPDSLDALATRFKTLKDGGLRMPAKHVRGRMGIPEPVEGEEVMGEASADATADGEKPGAGDGGGKKKPNDAADAADDDSESDDE